MRESVFKSVERRELTDSITDRMYNLIIGGITLYGLLLNAIMVATCHELAMSINPLVMIIGYFICVIVGSIITRSDNPIMSFIGYNLIVVPIGLLLAVCVPTYDANNILSAVVCTGAVTLLMMAIATIKPNIFLGLGRTLFITLLVSIIVEIVALLLGYGGDIFNWLFVIIFSGYIGFDWSRAQVMSKTVDNAVDAAVQIYLDIINLFLRILDILDRKRD